jgi:hypothetical protein
LTATLQGRGHDRQEKNNESIKGVLVGTNVTGAELVALLEWSYKKQLTIQCLSVDSAIVNNPSNRHEMAGRHTERKVATHNPAKIQ